MDSVKDYCRHWWPDMIECKVLCPGRYRAIFPRYSLLIEDREMHVDMFSVPCESMAVDILVAVVPGQWAFGLSWPQVVLAREQNGWSGDISWQDLFVGLRHISSTALTLSYVWWQRLTSPEV